MSRNSERSPHGPHGASRKGASRSDLPQSIRPSTLAREEKHSARVDDSEVLGLVRQRVLRLGPAVACGVRVTVRNGNVALSGIVGSDYERKLLVSEIQRIAFVGRVSDDLAIADAESEIAMKQPASAVSKKKTPRTKTSRNLEENRNSGLKLATQVKQVAKPRSALAAVAGLLCAAIVWWLQPVSVENSRVAGKVGNREGMPEARYLVQVPAQIRFRGGPAAGLVLKLHPIVGKKVQVRESGPQGRVLLDGNVQWKTAVPGDGLPPGEYAVTARLIQQVTQNAHEVLGENLIPPAYWHAEATPLRLVVASGRQTPWSLDLN